MKTKKLEEFQKEFNEVLEKTPQENLTILINNEIKEIEKYIENQRTSTLGNPLKGGMSISSSSGYKVFKVPNSGLRRIEFSNAFNKYNLFGIDNENALSEQAIEFVKYYRWLNDLANPKLAKKKRNNLTHPQKILALYYLGIDMSKFQNNVQSAKILSSILDLDESNTKDYLTYFEGRTAKVKKNNNIRKVSELFEHEDFKEVLDIIKQDL